MITLDRLAHITGGALVEPTQLDVQLSEITADSTLVRPGMLFAAIPGSQVHGAQFAQQAVAQGAAAIVTDEQGAAMIGKTHVPVLTVASVGERLGAIAAAVYGDPANHLQSFGVTGTNGKTTTTYMLEQILTAAGHSTALIGGVELRIGGVHTPTSITTPLPADIQRMLAQHVAAEGSSVVMEVTSHALAQHRTDPIVFSVVGFTQLSVDHLDYHDSIEDYFAAKCELFVAERTAAAVIVIDDEWGRRLHELASARIDNVYALAVDTQLPDGVSGWQVEAKQNGDFVLRGTEDIGGGVTEYTCGLPGTYNTANAALAVTMALVSGVPAHDVPQRIDPHVPGRMQVISQNGPRVIVDFAHNADALDKALAALRPTTVGRLIAVTGTAGDRDATKRFAMGEATAKNSDVVVITDDDPHTEDPAQIRRALIEGTEKYNAQIIEIGDRTEAIHEAIRMADDTDTVMIAGRGHWTVQFVGHDLVELDDREVARDALAARGVSIE